MSYSKAPPQLIHSSDSTFVLDYVSAHTRQKEAGNAIQHNVEELLQCRLCNINFGLKTTLFEHLNLHRQNSILSHKESVIDDIGNDDKIKGTQDETVSTGLVQLNQTGSFKLTCSSGRITSSLSLQMQNIGQNDLKLTDVFLFNNAVAVPLLDKPELLVSGDELDFALINCVYHCGEVNDYVVRYLQLPLKTEFIEIYRVQRCCFSRRGLESSVCNQYPLPKDIQSIVSNLNGTVAAPCLLSSSNYFRTFKRFIELEEYATYMELKNFDCEIKFTDETLRNLATPNTFSITIPNVLQKFPLLQKKDRFWLWLKGDTNLKNRIHANVTDILKSEIHVKVGSNKPSADKTYNIIFILNRYQIQMEHRALETMQKYGLIDFMFPAPLPPFRALKLDSHITELKWYNNSIRNNAEQCQAVLGIVNGVSYPAPYLIFGPPGTGKTATITEAICQLLRTRPDSRILVTATSNAAADELAQRLLQYLHNACYFNHKVYRLYAANVQREVTDPQLLANSNYNLGGLPEWQMLSRYRVLVCTLMTSGRLNLAAPRSSAGHFTHLFVDECGSSTETAALIPIAVCSSMGKINAHVILAGDPKQLGPVIISKMAEKMGFGESLIARLMNRESYQRNAITKAYSSRMLTQLLQNFRSHPDIINISNDLFYNSELVPKAPTELTDRYLGWWKLPVKNVPILFDVTVGIAARDANSPSWFNMTEVRKVINYVNILLRGGINGERIYEEDIGIISPYKSQCQKILMALRNCHHKIMTASVELFQGKEKSVIIVSTVRSGRQGIGFLNNPKRLNVLLTRAQSLMILIGDPNVLQKDRNWYDVLERLTNLRVITGQRFVLSSNRPSLLDEDQDIDNVSEEEMISQ